MARLKVGIIFGGCSEEHPISVKSAREVIDFEDVLLLMAGILAERDDIASTVRGQYRHFVVDEYQDVNAAQQALLDLWVGD